MNDLSYLKSECYNYIKKSLDENVENKDVHKFLTCLSSILFCKNFFKREPKEDILKNKHFLKIIRYLVFLRFYYENIKQTESTKELIEYFTDEIKKENIFPSQDVTKMLIIQNTLLGINNTSLLITNYDKL